MNFIGIDLHTNRFTCCYRDERRSDLPPDRVMRTFELDEEGLAAFYATLTPDTYILVEATITTFAFVRLFKDHVKEVIIGNTHQLKQISLARNNTDKIDADKLCQALKAQVLSGVQQVVPVTLPPKEIQDLRGLFTDYRLLQKQNIQIKNRIHSLLKEHLYGFTQEEIFDQKSRKRIRELTEDGILRVRLNRMMDRLEEGEEEVEGVKNQILGAAEPFMETIELLTSMKGVSVFIAAAIIADIIEVSRFKNAKHFTSYLRSAPKMANSNTTVKNRGTNKAGRKVSATLLTQSLNHVMAASRKLRKWYDRLKEYKKAGLVRTGLRRRVLAEIYQMLKKKEYHYGREPLKHQAKMEAYRHFLERQKKEGEIQKSA
jgi:transposase